MPQTTLTATRSLSDAPWILVTPASGVVDADTTPPDDESDLSFRFRVAHDDEALIVEVLVRDDVIVADSCEPGAISSPAWDDDAVEIFIDGDYGRRPDSRADGLAAMTHGGEFALVANGAASSDYSGYPNSFGTLWSGGVERLDEYTARYVFRITWAAMGLADQPGRIGFNISVQDDDDGGRRDHALYWRGTPLRPFVDEQGFGTLVFK